MDGTTELLRLVELLRLGAGTARQIADLRGRDRDEIYKLAEEAERMAVDLQRICDGSPSAPGKPN